MLFAAKGNYRRPSNGEKVKWSEELKSRWREREKAPEVGRDLGELTSGNATLTGPPDWTWTDRSRGRGCDESAQPCIVAAARADVAVRFLPPEDTADRRRTRGVSRRTSSVSMIGLIWWKFSELQWTNPDEGCVSGAETSVGWSSISEPISRRGEGLNRIQIDCLFIYKNNFHYKYYNQV